MQSQFHLLPYFLARDLIGHTHNKHHIKLEIGEYIYPCNNFRLYQIALQSPAEVWFVDERPNSKLQAQKLKGSRGQLVILIQNSRSNLVYIPTTSNSQINIIINITVNMGHFFLVVRILEIGV